MPFLMLQRVQSVGDNSVRRLSARLAERFGLGGQFNLEQEA